MKFHFLNLHAKRVRGFVMPFTLLICSILLSIATSISIILVKELYFSKVSRDSQIAYYAADNGMMCAVMVDDQYVDPDTGLGIFQYALSPTAQDVLTKINTAEGSTITLYNGNSIKCATSEIFNPSTNGFMVTEFPHTNSLGQSETGRTSQFTLHMDLGDGTTRCAKITVNKTPTFRQIISQGYTACPGGSIRPIERAIINTTEIQ
jgi:hypothetical protein